MSPGGQPPRQDAGCEHTSEEGADHAHFRSRLPISAPGHTQTHRGAPTEGTTARRGKAAASLNFIDRERETR